MEPSTIVIFFSYLMYIIIRTKYVGDTWVNRISLYIRRFLKKEGYLKFRGDIQKFELDVTNGEIDIFLNLQKCKPGYIILNYSQKNGTFQTFEKFKKLLVNIRQIIEK